MSVTDEGALPAVLEGDATAVAEDAAAVAVDAAPDTVDVREMVDEMVDSMVEVTPVTSVGCSCLRSTGAAEAKAARPATNKVLKENMFV